MIYLIFDYRNKIGAHLLPLESFPTFEIEKKWRWQTFEKLRQAFQEVYQWWFVFLSEVCIKLFNSFGSLEKVRECFEVLHLSNTRPQLYAALNLVEIDTVLYLCHIFRKHGLHISLLLFFSVDYIKIKRSFRIWVVGKVGRNAII